MDLNHGQIHRSLEFEPQTSLPKLLDLIPVLLTPQCIDQKLNAVHPLHIHVKLLNTCIIYSTIQ